MKKYFALGSIAIIAIFMTGCSNKDQHVISGDYGIYEVKVTKTTTDENGDWIVSGTTNAPDGSKIIATNDSDDDLTTNEADDGYGDWSKAKNGKFKATIDSVSFVDTSNSKVGKQVKIALFAIENYHKGVSDDLSSSIIKDFNDNYKPTTLSLSKSQVKYLKSLDEDDDESDSSSIDDNDNNSASASVAKSESEDSISNIDETSSNDSRNHGDLETSQQGSIIGNSRTMIYHTPEQHGYRMNSANAVYFKTEAEAQAAGYRKASR